MKILFITLLIFVYICISSFSVGLYVQSGLLSRLTNYDRGKYIVLIFIFGPISLLFFILIKLIKLFFTFGKNVIKYNKLRK